MADKNPRNQSQSEEPVARTTGESLDLGTVGGGRIPGGNSPTTVPSPNATADEHPAPNMGTTPTGRAPTTKPGGVNEIDPLAQGNLGGRNPDQSQTAMGSGPDGPQTTGTREQQQERQVAGEE